MTQSQSEKLRSPVPEEVRPIIAALRSKLPSRLDPIQGALSRKNGEFGGQLKLEDDVLVISFKERLDLSGSQLDAARGQMLYGLVSCSPDARDQLAEVLERDVPEFDGPTNDYVKVSIVELRRDGASYHLSADVTVDLSQLAAFNDYLEEGPPPDDQAGQAMASTYAWLFDLLRLVCRLKYGETDSTVGARFASMVEAFADEDEEIEFFDDVEGSDPLDVEGSAEASDGDDGEETAPTPAPKPAPAPAPQPRPAAKKAAPAPTPTPTPTMDPALEAKAKAILESLSGMDFKNEAISDADARDTLISYGKAGGKLMIDGKEVTVDVLGKVKPVIDVSKISVKRGKTALQRSQERRKGKNGK